MPLFSWRNNLSQALGLTARDHRSGRLVAVIECILNQNARERGAATYPASNQAVVQLCLHYDIGLLQIPCPEMTCLGWRRERPAGTTLRACLEIAAGWRCCQAISREVVDRVQDYLQNGCQLLAILGGNPESPGCAVHHERDQQGQERLADHAGILMRALQAELRKRALEIPFMGIRDYRPDLLRDDVARLEILFRRAGAYPNRLNR
jgi:predicted secreted protein